MPCLGQGSEWAKWCETIKGDRNANNHWFPTKMCTMPSLKHKYKLISSVATSKATSESGWWVSVPTSSWLPSRFLSCVAKFWRRSTSPCTSIRTLSWPCPIRSSAMRQGWSGCSFPSTPWCSSFTWITEFEPHKKLSHGSNWLARPSSPARESRMCHLLLHLEQPQQSWRRAAIIFLSYTAASTVSPHTGGERSHSGKLIPAMTKKKRLGKNIIWCIAINKWMLVMCSRCGWNVNTMGSDRNVQPL